MYAVKAKLEYTTNL